MNEKNSAQLPYGDTKIVAMVVHNGQVIVATTLHVYRLCDDGKFEAMEFVDVTGNN